MDGDPEASLLSYICLSHWLHYEFPQGKSCELFNFKSLLTTKYLVQSMCLVDVYQFELKEESEVLLGWRFRGESGLSSPRLDSPLHFLHLLPEANIDRECKGPSWEPVDLGQPIIPLGTSNCQATTQNRHHCGQTTFLPEPPWTHLSLPGIVNGDRLACPKDILMRKYQQRSFRSYEDYAIFT